MKSAVVLIATALAAITQAASVPAAETTQLMHGEIMNLTDTIWYKERYGDAEMATVAQDGAVLAKRDSCGSGTTYSVSEMRTLISNLQSDGGNDYVPAGYVHIWTRGTARICTYNRYIFENTHVSHFEQGWGADLTMKNCCNPDGNPQW